MILVSMHACIYLPVCVQSHRKLTKRWPSALYVCVCVGGGGL